MGVPKSALEQEAEADRAIEEAQKRKDNPSQPAKESVSPDARGKPAQEAQKPQQNADDQSDLVKLRAELEHECQMRKTLEGRVNSQLKPANEENRRLKAELEATEERIRALEQASKKPGVERYLSDKELSELGEVADLNSRMIKGILEEELEKNGVTAVVDRVMKESERAREAAVNQPSGPSPDFWPAVDQYCPGARQLNRDADPRWIEFLDLYDASTGRLNREMAEEAIESDSPAALANMFASFMRKNGIVQEQPANNQPASERAPKPERGGRGNAQPNGGSNEVEPWTSAEVRAFYTDISKGKFRGRDAERIELEAKLMAAVAAGKIT